MIDKDKLMGAITSHRDNSYGSDETSSLGQKRAKAIEYYLGLNTNPAPEGRSQVVDRSVYETIQVLLPSLVKIFSGSSDEVCKAMPIGPDDEAGADQTTAVLRHYVTEKNNWEQICSDWIHDSLLLGNSYCMAYWDESDRMVRETYLGQSEDQLTMLLQDANLKIVQQSRKIDKQATSEAQKAYQAQLIQYQQMVSMGQQIPPPQDPGKIYTYDVVIERLENEGSVCIQTLPPEHCIISTDTPDWTLEKCPYFEFRQQKSIDDIRKMGLEVDDDISDDEAKFAMEDLSRNRFSENNQFSDYGNNEGSSRKVWVRSIWVKADVEGDGKERLYYVIAVGKEILYSEPCVSIPVASMTSEPLPHRHIGMSVAESVMDIQDIKQAVKRGALDNLYLANNGRHVISSKVNVEDFLDARPGGVIRMTDDSALPSEGHVMPLVHPFSFDTIVGSLEYFDQDRQNRTGASRYFSGTDAGAINKTMGGTIALQNMASMRVEHKARMMAPAVETLFRIVWELISKHANKPLSLKLNGKWTLVDPQAWRTRRDIKISVGVGAGNKETMMGQLAQIFNAQMQLLPLGVAGPSQIHATVIEMAKLGGFSNPDKFWIDPRQNPPPPPPPNPDLIKIQAEQQAKQIELQAEAQKFQAEAILKREELMFQAQEAEKDRLLEIEKAKMSEATKLAIAEMNRETTLETTDRTQQFEAGKMQVQMSREDQMKAQEDQKAMAEEQKTQEQDDGMKELLGNLQGAIQALAEGMSRPKQVVRGPDGKIVGVQ